MSTKSNYDLILGPSEKPRPFVAWYFFGDGEDLRDEYSHCQMWQDLIVVMATTPEEAIEKAYELLAARCGDSVTFTRVVCETELEAVLGLLRRVGAGEVRPATLEDEHRDIWVERYLNGENI